MEEIVFERDGYDVRRASYGFDVYRQGATASERCARIGFRGQSGLDRAKAEIERRLSVA